jgi:hypothetical protein
LKADKLWHFKTGKWNIHKFCPLASYTEAGAIIALQRFMIEKFMALAASQIQTCEGSTSFGC